MSKGCFGTHYVVSNERNIDLLAVHAAGLGGAYVGVGTDQNLFLIASIRPSLALLTDYDTWAVAVNKAHVAFLAKAETPRDFVRAWNFGRDGTSVETLRQAGLNGTDVAIVRRVAPLVRSRLIRAAARAKKTPAMNFLANLDAFQFLKSLATQGRIVPVRANWILRHGAVEAAAKCAKDQGLTVRALYLSNAEDYWKTYPPELRDNVGLLPADAQSVVLRTQATGKASPDLRYNVQHLRVFAEWLRAPSVVNNRCVVHRPPYADPREVQLTWTNDGPPPAHCRGDARGAVLARRLEKTLEKPR